MPRVEFESTVAVFRRSKTYVRRLLEWAFAHEISIHKIGFEVLTSMTMKSFTGSQVIASKKTELFVVLKGFRICFHTL
jgi:hypothetical protein